MTNEMLEGKPSNARNWIITYLDGVLRGLIVFAIVGVGFYIFLVGFLKMKPIFILPLAFIISILLSPFLSKIKLGERVLNWYEGWLHKTFIK